MSRNLEFKKERNRSVSVINKKTGIVVGRISYSSSRSVDEAWAALHGAYEKKDYSYHFTLAEAKASF